MGKVRRITAEALQAAEDRAETMAPAAQRHQVLDSAGAVIRRAFLERSEWRDPDDLDVRARLPKVVSGYRRVETLRNLHLRRSLVTEGHIAAAERLIRDFEISQGAKPGYEPFSLRSNGAPAGPGDFQLDGATRYREAVQALGKRASAVVLPVVLDNATLSDLSRSFSITSDTALGLLVAALDRLVEHYSDDGTPDHA